LINPNFSERVQKEEAHGNVGIVYREQKMIMRNSIFPVIQILLLGLLPLILFSSSGHAAETDPPPDEVTVKGTTLKGRVMSLETGGIRFETIYGEGEILIRYEDIEQIQTQREYRIYYSDNQIIQGRLVGKEGESLLVGADTQNALRLNSGVIVRGIPEVTHERSWIARLRTQYPWWKASLDAGWEFETTAVDKTKIFLGFNAERRKSPTRLVGDLRYALETQRTATTPKTTTKDELSGFLLGEYDLSRKWFLFAYPAAEWDRPRGIKVRAYPGVGLGFRFVETEKALLQLQLGPGYVYEEFTDLGSNDYWAAFIGLEARYAFRSYFNTRLHMLWMPDIQDVNKNWLYRGELEFAVPITQLISMKLRFTQVNDNNPSPDVGNNKLTSTLLLSLGF
jgi:hypothetical protein